MLIAIDEETGNPVPIGSEIIDFRGDKAILEALERVRTPYKSGKIFYRDADGKGHTVYDKVFGIRVVDSEDAEENVSRIFAAVGMQYGYTHVTVDLEPFERLKIRWQISYKWARFTISDSLKDAPYNVIESIAITTFSKISGGQKFTPYSKAAIAWVSEQIQPSGKETGAV